MVGTVDTWLIWNLTNRTNYVTDVTNASRTMLMNISTLKWDRELCDFYGIDMKILPKIVSSSEPTEFGTLSKTAFDGIPIAGCLGEGQAFI